MNWLQVVKNLIQDGQLDIVGGGIVQHDEALTSPLEAFEQVGRKRTNRRTRLFLKKKLLLKW